MLPDFRLIDAIKQGSLEDAKQAIADGANICLREYGKFTVLQLVERSGHNELVPLLVHCGANPNAVIDKLGNTLLHHAARYGNHGFAAALLANGAQVDVQNKSGKTPLHIARSHGHDYIAKLLIDFRADIESPCRHREMALREPSSKSNSQTLTR